MTNSPHFARMLRRAIKAQRGGKRAERSDGYESRTNADRAERAEKAVLAYIDYAGDDVAANGVDTWFCDLLCDLRHLAAFLGFEFNPEAGAGNFDAETIEDPNGKFKPSAEWYVEGAQAPKRTSKEGEI